MSEGGRSLERTLDYTDLLRPGRYPRSSRYDPGWLLALDMGPHPLWLLENLLPHLEVAPGTRVLDLGCGKGATSIFLAREFDARVTGVDWWIRADERAAVAHHAGAGHRVRNVRAEAHALPFERDAFDLVVCIDAYEYFGDDPDYLPYLTDFVRPGGRIAVATPALRRPIGPDGVPLHVQEAVGDEALAWHTAEEWRDLWTASGRVEVEVAELQPDGWDDWLRWQRAADRSAGHFTDSAVVDMLLTDAGKNVLG